MEELGCVGGGIVDIRSCAGGETPLRVVVEMEREGCPGWVWKLVSR